MNIKPFDSISSQLSGFSFRQPLQPPVEEVPRLGIATVSGEPRSN
jgi:hypothetical protein